MNKFFRDLYYIGLNIKYIVVGFFMLILGNFYKLKYRKLYKERYDICMNCNKRDGVLCSECNCVIAAKTKSGPKGRSSKCPLGKWE